MTTFDFKIIKNEVEYENALQRLDIVFDAQKGTPEGEELELLSFLIDSYEKVHFPI